MTAMSVLAVTAFYWVPVLEQILSGGFLYAASEFNLANEMLEVKDLLSNSAPAMGIGLFVLCLPRIFLSRTEGEKRSVLIRFADGCLLFGLLFSLGATRLFPWARVQNLLSFIQFPWRLFIVSSTLLSFAAAIYMSDYFKEENKKETALLIVLAVMIVGFAGNITNNEQTTSTVNKNAKYSDITFSKDKTNVYFFWGDGCGYCEKEMQFWNKIQNEYGDLYNLYALEVWSDEKHSQLLEEVGETLNKEITGVPFTIIGDETFSGFSASMEDNMIAAIKAAHENRVEDTAVDTLMRKWTE